MVTGSLGTSVISWSQTEVDGVAHAPLDLLVVGASWRWCGQAVRVDTTQDALILDGAEGAAEIRKRAARMVRRLIGAAVAGDALPGPADEQAQPRTDGAEDRSGTDQGFVVTDGIHSFAATLLPVPDTGARLIMFVGALPPVDRDLWVVRAAIDRNETPAATPPQGGVICFTPGTRIATPGGLREISTLRPGDAILTRDNGPQPVVWTGHRRMSGARLYAMAHLRPIRFRAGAIDQGIPDGDLLVSPQHRMLIRGAAAQALFNTPEVLVTARDLLNDRTITVDTTLREVTYVHILLERHNIVWANGLETESFHPSNTALELIAPDQRGGLLQILPGLARDPHAYGDFARRNLSPSEAAILRHDLRA